MAKAKSVFYCSDCGHESAKWLGKCPSCNNWNTFVEEIVQKSNSKPIHTGSIDSSVSIKKSSLKTLSEVEAETISRFKTNSSELNLVTGGGFVKGSVVLVAGEPGIGKSTLMLQMAMQLSKHNVVYVSGEESLHQIKLRSNRLELNNPDCLFTTETATTALTAKLSKVNPDIVIIDSIQTIFNPLIDSLPGSISQIKQTSAELTHFAKKTNTCLVIIGHINKEGSIAGPKLLEHMVDTVLYFEGESKNNYRIIRAHKNRFGNTSEIGIFEMTAKGLIDISNPSGLLLNQANSELSGIAIGAAIEGKRSLLIETQALVTNAVYSSPQRSCTGFNSKRLNMLLAVLDKRCGYQFGLKDVFVNIAGGITVSDPSLDLSVIAALISSFDDISLSHEHCFIGEVGLSGEVRPVPRITERLVEAQKLGFKKAVISKNQKITSQQALNISIEPLATVKSLYHFFENY